MTDKERILAKIQSLLNDTNYDPFTDEVFGRSQVLKELKSYIDSLQEEPLSEELENNAIQYAGKHAPYDDAMDEVKEAFKAGAKWQKQQDKETIEIAEDHAMFAGMEKMREQMMKDAIDGEIFDIFYQDGDCLEIHTKIPEDKFQDGDKVKLIIIKKE